MKTVKGGAGGERRQPRADRRFWAAHRGTPIPTPNTVAALLGLLTPDTTLLDAGAGEGRYALALASSVRRVTALDYSPVMRARLRARLAALELAGDGPGSVHVRAGHYLSAQLPRHDAVLAAWSLYSATDLDASLRALLRHARSQLIVLDDPGPAEVGQRGGSQQEERSPHAALLGVTLPERPSRATLIERALGKLGAPVERRHIAEVRRRVFPDADALCRRLAPSLPPGERDAFLAGLQPYLREEAGALVYLQPFTVALLRVQRG